MKTKNAHNWKTIAILYQKTFEIYIFTASKIKNDTFPEIVKISRDAMSDDNVSEHVDQIQETTRGIYEKISRMADYYGKMRLDAYETAGQLYEEMGDLQHAAEMYAHSYDYCVNRSVELFEKIAKGGKSDEM